MNRKEFKAAFGCEHAVVLPVIHAIDSEQTLTNIERAIAGGCPGVFLINHDFGIDPFLPIIKEARSRFPDCWIGLNFLAVTGRDAFPVLAQLEQEACPINAYWADDARMDESRSSDDQPEGAAILETKNQVNWNGMYFGGTSFKKQREVAPDHYAQSAAIACNYMDVVTTSGVATGKAADKNKIEIFRKACGEKPIALASGITPENVGEYANLVDCLMVATGINVENDFYNIDLARLQELMLRLNT